MEQSLGHGRLGPVFGKQSVRQLQSQSIELDPAQGGVEYFKKFNQSFVIGAGLEILVAPSVVLTFDARYNSGRQEIAESARFARLQGQFSSISGSQDTQTSIKTTGSDLLLSLAFTF